MPLIEAFYKRVPVLAYAATAVPATMDGGGVLYDTRDPRRVAALMHGVLVDADARGRGSCDAQDAALARLRAQDFDGTRASVRRRGARGAATAARPRSRTTSGASSCWPKSSRRSASTRPAAFRALPLAPDDARPVADLGHRR